MPSLVQNARDLVAVVGGDVLGVFPSTNAVVVQTLPGSLAAIRALPFVRHAAVDGKRLPTAVVEREGVARHLDRLDQDDLNLDGIFRVPASEGEGVTVYVLDTGINTFHEEYANLDLDGRNFTGLVSSPLRLNIPPLPTLPLPPLPGPSKLFSSFPILRDIPGLNQVPNPSALIEAIAQIPGGEQIIGGLSMIPGFADLLQEGGDNLDVLVSLVGGSVGLLLQDPDTLTDCHGHGTIISAAAVSNTLGVARKAKLRMMRTAGCDGITFDSTALRALEFIRATRDEGPAIVNMSFGTDAEAPLAFAEMIDLMTSEGVVFVASAGNNGQQAGADSCRNVPAALPSVISVGASAFSTDDPASFSITGACVDLYAPGQSVTMPNPLSVRDTGAVSGTSLSSPLVAGAIAVMLSEGRLDPLSASFRQDLIRELTRTAPDGRKLLRIRSTEGPEEPGC